jgi:L,D-peptidoglycan transpeptidase YkuD (ErfK/YbiS/YcfS/YnhG family)
MNYAPLLKDSLQYILVTAKDWDSIEATMTLFERKTLDSKWQISSGPFDVVLGKKGLAWGKGLHTIPADNNPKKKEGDLRAPAGVFNLSFAFGYSPIKTIRWPYLAITENMIAVDDPKSDYYNCVVDKSLIEKIDWDSKEIMLREDGLYKCGLVIDYNMYPAIPGAGSCIFMHIWRGPGMGTEGCTAMPEEKMKIILDWLDPDANPVLVQVPAHE